mmetsp:Transcript_15073/g.59040  ORF Transcript_15073/g.59040 Transcript_15073/m.59040 type:complete len:145 (-) Transcript_15073:309-743(-)
MDLLSQEQISEFKEAFNMFADGGDVITKDTLAPVMKQMGMRPNATELGEMLSEASDSGRSVAFAEFCAMMADRMTNQDDSATIIDAFESFDPEATGKISKDEFRRLLAMGGGDKFTGREVRFFPPFAARPLLIARLLPSCSQDM